MPLTVKLPKSEFFNTSIAASFLAIEVLKNSDFGNLKLEKN